MAPEKGWTKSDPLRHGESTRCRVGDADVTWTYTPINAYVTYGGRTLNVTTGRGVDMTALAEDLAEEGWELEGIDIVLELGRLDALSRDVLRFLEALPSGRK